MAQVAPIQDEHDGFVEARHPHGAQAEPGAERSILPGSLENGSLSVPRVGWP